LDYQGLQAYFGALRAAFDDLTIERGIVIVEDNYVACQTTIVGTFAREFTNSAVGPLPPNGQRVTFELTNIFHYDDEGRVAERLLIAATMLGLGAGIGWVRQEKRAPIGELLGVPGGRYVRTIMAVGHPSERAREFKTQAGEARIPLERLVSYR
jgi:nitroreductase